MTDPIPVIEADASKVKAWYESHLFYAGVIAGAVSCFIVMQVIRHL